MDPVLSVILPVRNVESVVANRIHDLLEILSEITAHFELLLVDTGSIDQTEEVIQDLLPSYPQLKFLRIDSREDDQVALQAGFDRAQGDIVMLCEDTASISSLEIHRLWELRNDQQLLVARSEPTIRRIHRPALMSSPLHSHPGRLATDDSRIGGIQMVRRSAVQRLDPPARHDILFPRAALTRAKHSNGRASQR